MVELAELSNLILSVILLLIIGVVILRNVLACIWFRRLLIWLTVVAFIFIFIAWKAL